VIEPAFAGTIIAATSSPVLSHKTPADLTHLPGIETRWMNFFKRDSELQSLTNFWFMGLLFLVGTRSKQQSHFWGCD
jgi:hypothetical protein